MEDNFSENENEQRPDFSGLLNKVKNYLLQNYHPVFDPKEAELHFTTEEIYNQLQKILCNETIFSPADVSLWLHNAGFVFHDFGEFRFEWLVKKT